jgi:signal transduction histidine kinase
VSTVLIVEDDAQQLRLYSRALQLAGYAVAEASSGTTGLAEARARRPAVILSDIRMPDVSGLDLLRSIRADPDISATPVILMTAEAVSDLQRTAMHELADDILQKPLAPATLVHAVKARLERDRLSRARADRRMEKLRRSVMAALPHELQTPLSVILGYAQLLRSEAYEMDPRDVARTAGIIHESGHRLERLVERYLDFVELEVLRANRDQLAASPMQSSSCQAVIVRAATEVADRHRRVPDLTVQCEDARAAVPERWLRTAVSELVDNACKFSEPGTPIGLKAVSGPAGMMDIKVSDQGNGLTSGQLDELEPLVQFDRQAHEQAGTGIGLALVRSLSDVFGGSFEVSPGPSKGLTVRVSLPMHAEAEAAWSD